MDPLAAWKELLNALTEMDWERVLETAENLLDWITNGGFHPELIALTGDGQSYLGRVVYGPELNRTVVDAACRFAMQLAIGMLKNQSTILDDVRSVCLASIVTLTALERLTTRFVPDGHESVLFPKVRPRTISACVLNAGSSMSHLYEIRLHVCADSNGSDQFVLVSVCF